MRAGHDVRAFVLYNSFNSWGWLDRCSADVRGKFEVFAGDIRDPNGVRDALKGCEAVMHLAALIAIPWKDLVRYEIKTGDTEGLVNYPLTIQGIRMAALIIDRDEEVKCSFRSKGDFDVNVFARKYFEGGGHVNAAGGRSNETLEATVQRFVEALKENSSQLQ